MNISSQWELGENSIEYKGEIHGVLRLAGLL